MMKRAVITGKRKAEIVEVPIPQPKEDWALVKIHSAPMCTEYKSWLDGTEVDLLGHEASGEVVEIDQACKVNVGDRVAVMPQLPCGKCRLCISGDYIHCQNNYDYKLFIGTDSDNSTMAQYILKPSWLLLPIPDNISYDLASLTCCALGPTFGAMQNMKVDAFDTVMITGAGPVGLGGIVNAKFLGAKVIIVQKSDWRKRRAKELGADIVLDPTDKDILRKINEFTNFRGVDVSIECSGSTKAQRLCIDATRRKGKVSFIGECEENLSIQASPDLIRKGLTIMGIWHYNLSYYSKIIKVIQDSPVIDKLISHVFPLKNIQKAMETCASHNSAKVILKPWE